MPVLSQTERPARQHGLDLLRSVAIVIVVFFHAGLFGFVVPGDYTRFGFCGVDLFFVLSGYLIGGQLSETIGADKPKWLSRFFARRAFRILPAYLFTLAIYFLMPIWREYPDISPVWKFLLSLQNIGLHGGLAFSHAWSLAVEDQFYLLLPFTLLLIKKHKLAPYLVPFVILVSGVVLRGYLASQHFDGTEVGHRIFQSLIYYPTWSRLDGLTLGVVLAAVQKYKSQWWQHLTNSATWLWLPATLILCLSLSIGDINITVQTCSWQFPLTAVAMAAFLVCAVSPRLPINRVNVPFVAFLATISYSVYLTHKLVIHAFSNYFASHNVDDTSLLAHVVLELSIYAVGAVVFFAVEKPFLAIRDQVSP